MNERKIGLIVMMMKCNKKKSEAKDEQKSLELIFFYKDGFNNFVFQ